MISKTNVETSQQSNSDKNIQLIICKTNKEKLKIFNNYEKVQDQNSIHLMMTSVSILKILFLKRE